MFWSTRRKKDSVFVARTLRTYDLDPSPTPGYYDMPDYRCHVDGWERVIERYPWGVVMYVDSPGASETLVIRGEYDPATGVVIEDGRPVTISTPWYPTLVRRCEMAKIETPECAGYWAACVTCDGGPNPESGAHEDACSYRSRCRVIQAHLIELDTDPRAYERRYGDDALPRLVARLEKAEKPIKRRAKRKKVRKKVPRKLTSAQKRERRYAGLKKMALAFYDELRAAVDKRKVVCCNRRTEAVRPGCIYLVDRTAKGVYYSIYMRRAKGRAYKLGVIRLVPINGGIDIQLPEAVTFSEKLPEDLRATPWNDPPMASVVRTLKTPEHYRWVAKQLAASALEALEAPLWK